MKRRPLNYRTAMLSALGLSILVHVLFLVMFHYGRSTMGDKRFGPDDIFWIKQAVSFGIVFLSSFVLFAVNFFLLRHWRNPGHRLHLVIVLSTLAGAVIMSLIFSHLQIELFNIDRHPERFIHSTMMRDVFLSIIIIFASQLLYLSNRKQEIALENEKLTAENARTRYESLKNQVDPHFLFNSLNTVNSLIRTDPDKAQEYVQRLSDVFRYTLQNRKDIITVEEELEFTRSYCALMKLRYGDSIIFRFETERLPGDWLVIPLSVQTLVENAIKHNVATARSPLEITVTGREGTISVSNPIRPRKQAEPGSGFGLASLAERYRLRWNRDIIICEDNGIFSVTIPAVGR